MVVTIKRDTAIHQIELKMAKKTQLKAICTLKNKRETGTITLCKWKNILLWSLL